MRGIGKTSSTKSAATPIKQSDANANFIESYIKKFRKKNSMPVSIPPNHINVMSRAASSTTTVVASQILASNGVGAYYAPYNPIGASASGYAITKPSSKNIISLHGNNNDLIVTLENDGSVVWADGINIDEAATAFSSAVTLGAERIAGISTGTKQRIRDAVFEEMISMCNEKGSLTSDDLTYLWQAAKIMDKLKGIQ